MRTILPAAPLLALLALAGCAAEGRPPPPSASLPESPGGGFTDPARSAILSASYAFNHPATLQGRPAEAAQVLAQLEFLAVEIPTGPRFIAFDPLTAPELVAARDEARRVLGISPAAAPQAVIDALIASAAAHRREDRAGAAAALAPIATPERGGGEGLAGRLAALPPLPRAGWATMRAQQAMTAADRDDRRGRFRRW